MIFDSNFGGSGFVHLYLLKYSSHSTSKTETLIFKSFFKTNILSSLTSFFSGQQGLDSATCLDRLIAFLHLTRSRAKEVNNHSLSRSLLMLSNHCFFGQP